MCPRSNRSDLRVVVDSVLLSGNSFETCEIADVEKSQGGSDSMCWLHRSDLCPSDQGLRLSGVLCDCPQ